MFLSMLSKLFDLHFQLASVVLTVSLRARCQPTHRRERLKPAGLDLVLSTSTSIMLHLRALRYALYTAAMHEVFYLICLQCE